MHTTCKNKFINFERFIQQIDEILMKHAQTNWTMTHACKHLQFSLYFYFILFYF